MDISEFVVDFSDKQSMDFLKNEFQDIFPFHFYSFIQEMWDWQFDMDFAQKFARFCPIEDTDVEDFLSKIISCKYGNLLCGIRFKGGMLNFPFVEIYPDFHLEESMLEEIADKCSLEFAKFDIKAIRFWKIANYVFTLRKRLIDADLIYYVGYPLNSKPIVPSSEFKIKKEVNLNFYNTYLKEFIKFCNSESIGKELELSSEESFEQSINESLCFSIYQNTQWLGIISAVKDKFLDKDAIFINEEFIASDFHSKGLGSSLQYFLHSQSQSRLIVGTIHSKNIASQKTATKCGRRALMCSYFYYIDR